MRILSIVLSKLALCVTVVAASERPLRERREQDHVLVKFRVDEAQAATRGWARPLKRLGDRLGLDGVVVRRNALANWRRVRDRTPEHEIDYSQFMYVSVPPGLTPEACVARLEGHPLVDYVEVNARGSVGATIPGDPDVGKQWYLSSSTGVLGRISAPEAWDLTTGSEAITVAILDTGCNTNLEEFSGRTVAGYDFVNSDTDPDDDHGHGTGVTAVLGASANNATNGAGVDWQCRLMPIKVFNAAGDGTADVGALGIDWAVLNGAKVINLSGGYFASNNTMRIAITNAVARGVVVVTITHNDGGALRFPAWLPETIAVGGVNSNGVRYSNSNFGPAIDLVAPAEVIYRLQLNGSYGYDVGTSYAGPQVAGVASLLCGLRPDLDNEQVRALLCAGAADQVSADTNDVSGFDVHYGWGRLNAYHSLQLSRTLVETPFPTNSGQVAIAWGVPASAFTNRPFRVHHATSVTGSWNVASNVVYEGTTRATWTDTAAAGATFRFYRVGIKTY
jgi:hypothetical protein